MEKLSTLRANLETDRTLLGERQTNLETLATALQDQDGALAGLQAQRAALVQGRAALEVETELRTLIEDATNVHETARKAHAEAVTSLALARAAEVTAAKSLHETEEDSARAELALDVALAGLSIDRRKLDERLAHDETWIADQRKDLDALRESVTRHRATRDERQRSLDEHSANGRPDSDRDVAQACAIDARAQVEDM